jgi:hypothetical protein
MRKAFHRTQRWRIPIGLLVFALILRLPSLAEHSWFVAAPGGLTRGELELLASSTDPPEPLLTKLQVLLETPLIRNDASVSQMPPKRPASPELGPLMRVAFWNLEQGARLDLVRLAMTDADRFVEAARSRRTVSDAEAAEADRQSRILQGVDVLVLNEVDKGLPRSDYRDVAAELAQELQMNYVYGIEFVEVDPNLLETDPDQRFRGLHGNAILSRYHIRRARVVRLPTCHDWYARETEKVGKLEGGRRWAAGRVFKEKITRQVRRGARMALVTDLAVPELPGGEVTVISVHLENRTNPDCRRRQLGFETYQTPSFWQVI